MNLIPINLATEDELSEVTLSRIVDETKRFAVGFAYGRSGFGYLRRTIQGWNAAATGIPFVVLADLDTTECPASLIRNWLPGAKHPNLLFRIAVREVESWLLADPVGLSDFLSISKRLVPPNPDTLADPKLALINLARQSRSKTIRDRLVPRRNSTAKQGPDYNACLGSFVRTQWDPGAARMNSPSLARTVDRLLTFTPDWSEF